MNFPVGTQPHDTQPHDRHGLAQVNTPEMGVVLTVLSPTGGVGATTLATNLAVRLASKRRHTSAQVGLMDADVGFGLATAMAGARPPRSLADLDSQVNPDALLAAVQPLECGLEVLASPADPIAAEGVVPATCARVIRLLAQRHAVTVIDTAPGLGEPTLTAIDHADVVLIPVLGTPSGCRATATVITTLKRIGVGDSQIRLAANRVGSPHALSAAQIADALSFPVDWTIPDSPDVVLAARRGRLLAWDWPDHPVSTALDRIAADVLDAAGGDAAKLVTSGTLGRAA